jgi:hypothetical protein
MAGGEPDIGLDLPGWLEQRGWRVERLSTIVAVVDRWNFVWRWPDAFFETNIQRLQDLKLLTAGEVARMQEDMVEARTSPGVRMITPLVGEIIARAP